MKSCPKNSRLKLTLGNLWWRRRALVAALARRALEYILGP